jgi:hypothetical protein
VASIRESIRAGVPRGSAPIVACFLVLVFAGAGMSQMNVLLGGMRPISGTANTLSDLTPLFDVGAAPEKAAGVLKAWREYERTAQEAGPETPTAGAREVARWFIALDALLFVFAYLLGLLFFFRLAREQDAERGRLARAGAIAVGLTALFDEIENGLYLGLVERGLRPESPDLSSERFELLAGSLAVASGLKWVFATLAVLISVALAWIMLTTWRKQLLGLRRARLRRSVKLTAPHLLLVVVFGLGVLGHEQLADLIRRWTVVELTLALGFAYLFAQTTWLVTRRLLRGTRWRRRAGEREEERKQLLFWIVVGAALAQLAVFIPSRHDPVNVGWGLAVPAALLFLLWVLGKLLPKQTAAPPPVATVREQRRGEPRRPNPAPVDEPRLPRVLGASVLVLLGLGLVNASFVHAVYTRQWTSRPLILIGATVAGLLVLALVRRWVPWERLKEPLGGATLGLALGLVYLAVRDGNEQLDPSAVVAVGALLPVAGWRLYWAFCAAPPPRPALSWKPIAALGVTLALFAGAFLVRPGEFGGPVGALAILLVFLLTAACAIAFLMWANSGIPVPRALAALGLQRFPLLTLLVVWVVVVSALDQSSYHELRLKDADEAARGVELAAAFDCWLAKNGLESLGTTSCTEVVGPEGGSASTPGAKPMIFVASTGGGIRASYWTALVLDCALEVDLDELKREAPCVGERPTGFERSRAVFAASGISGGSVGLAAYAAHLTTKQRNVADPGWIDDSLSIDPLSPLAAWWLFAEVPRAFLRFDTERDRAGVFEAAFEEPWPAGEFEQGIVELWHEHPETPLLLLNGTNVADGCRFNVSALDGSVETTDPDEHYNCRSMAPFDERRDTSDELDTSTRVHGKSVLTATRDLVDYLCGERYDLRLSTASFASARFPFVNPSGRIERRCAVKTGKKPVAHVVDGGYLDTSGASPVNEMMEALRPKIDEWNTTHADAGSCVVPFLIQIDNGFEDASPPTAPRRPSELTLPLTTVLASRIGRAAQARAEAALSFELPFAGALVDEEAVRDRYAHFVNQAHAGPGAPLGWTQSNYSEQELRSQRRQPKNLEALLEVRSWFAAARSGELGCAAAPPSDDS